MPLNPNDINGNLQNTLNSVNSAVTNDKNIGNNSNGESTPDSVKVNNEVTESQFAVTLKGGGATSRFNPITVFRYFKFGPFNKGEYKNSLHKDKNLFSGAIPEFKELDKADMNQQFNYFNNIVPISNTDLRMYNDNDIANLKNPTASSIIKWSKSLGEDGVWSYGPVPYSVNDFIYCKYYGKVPNNRLVTLRRYPEPVEDNVRKVGDDGKVIPMIPIAQAVTWFGEDVNNSLSSILKISWDIKWKTLQSKYRDIDQNDVTLDNILKSNPTAKTGISDDGAKIAAAYAKILNAGNNEEEKRLAVYELIGYDDKIKEYIKKAYDTESGTFWDRILGPVNVTDRIRIRDRGLGQNMFDSEIKLTFEYSLRSFDGENPKIAFLDIISNFLALTYNEGTFWGGTNRVFKTSGIVLGPGAQNFDNFEQYVKFNINEAKNGIASTISSIIGKDEAKIKSINKLIEIGENGNANEEYETGFVDLIANHFLENFYTTPIQKPRLLKGEPVGEWHLTIGNPVNPIAVIGNLVVSGVNMKLGETLGDDDFPTEIKFDVTLKHGRPRHLGEIESIFNLGNGAMSFKHINPSSYNNTNSDKDSEYNSSTGEKQEGSIIQETNTAISGNENDFDVKKNDGYYNKMRDNIYEHYGKTFGNSSYLDILLDVKTTSSKKL